MSRTLTKKQEYQTRNFLSCSFTEAFKRLEALALAESYSYCVSLNAYALYWAERDEEYRRTIVGAAVVLPDGASVVLASRLSSAPVLERLTGFDLAESLFERAGKSGWRVRCFGMHKEVLLRLQYLLPLKHPGIKLSVHEVDGFEAEREPAHLALVALPQPMQEKWIAQNMDRLNSRLVMGVGGALEVFSGMLPRAPKLWRRLGLEWLYRFLLQPRLRWKKTWISTVWFGGYLLRRLIGI